MSKIKMGLELTMQLLAEAVCPHCGGTKYEPGKEAIIHVEADDCPSCGGSGQCPIGTGEAPWGTSCPWCDSTGKRKYGEPLDESGV